MENCFEQKGTSDLPPSKLDHEDEAEQVPKHHGGSHHSKENSDIDHTLIEKCEQSYKKYKTSIRRAENVKSRPPPIPKLQKIDGLERMRQETKLLVLEYLSSLPPEIISARNKGENRGNVTSASVKKAKTIHACDRPFMEATQKRNRVIIRRNSEQYDRKVREQLQKMADPLRRKLTPEILSDIEVFDKKCLEDALPRKSLQALQFARIVHGETQKSPESPVTCATHRLEEMSQDIMKDYPQLLDEHLSDLLTPLESNEKMTYEQFAVVAKPVFEKHLARLTGSIWTKVALVFYLVKEVLYSGNLTDLQVELLVEYATRFITESSFEKINKEGGWAALEAENENLLIPSSLRGELYHQGDSIDMDTVDGSSTSEHHVLPVEANDEAAGYLGYVTNVVKEWTTYSVAAIALGVGFAFAYLKRQ